MAWPDWHRPPPLILRQIYATACDQWRWVIAARRVHYPETYLTYDLSLPVHWIITHQSQTTLSSHAVVSSCRLQLTPALLKTFSSLQIDLKSSCCYSLRLWSCAVHCSACLAMLCSFSLSTFPGQFHSTFPFSAGTVLAPRPLLPRVRNVQRVIVLPSLSVRPKPVFNQSINQSINQSKFL